MSNKSGALCEWRLRQWEVTECTAGRFVGAQLCSNGSVSGALDECRVESRGHSQGPVTPTRVCNQDSVCGHFLSTILCECQVFC